MIDPYYVMGTKLGFNKSVRHVRFVTNVVKQMATGVSFIDALNNIEKALPLERSQLGPLMKAVVVERLGYAVSAINLSRDINKEAQSKIADEVEKWGKIQGLMIYHHPQIGAVLADPAELKGWQDCGEMARHEMVVIYMKAHEPKESNLEQVAIDSLVSLLQGEAAEGMSRLYRSKRKLFTTPAPPKPAPTATQPARGQRSAARNGKEVADQTSTAAPTQIEPAALSSTQMQTMTPKYSVQVSNEFFHNGNVEAWKNIVESYKTVYPGSEVHIFHQGEKVNNINALFKWGKVKHGDVLLFSVSGPEIRGVAKLQRYLYEGASLRYENYLKKDVNKILPLF